MKRFHPEGIPWPGTVLYNALSRSEIFLRHYQLVAHDIARYGEAGCILDIGTGPGQLLWAMRKVMPDTRLVGVDISPSMVTRARRNMETYGRDPRIELRVASAEVLPFAGGTFDRVVSTGSLHHWKDPIRALSEAHRVLKADGYALIYDLVRDMPEGVRRDLRTQFGGFRLALLCLHSFEEPFLDAEEMGALGRQTDFEVEGTTFTGAFCCLVLKKAAHSLGGLGHAATDCRGSFCCLRASAGIGSKTEIARMAEKDMNPYRQAKLA
ncbi:MAG: class I SAM-dependent methyltransferase [Deltaproteobacteria bacterium]|nr:class I SAM-dependent methyltransferase [Deltaproteobacteria bacterium]